MNQNFDLSTTLPYLEATMNFSQFDCTDLTPELRSVRTIKGWNAKKPERTRLIGFLAYLSGRVQRV